MQMKKTLLAALLAAVPFSTMAADKSAGHLDVYYVDSESEVNPGVDDDGDGFGARISGKFSDMASVYGEYQASSYDDTDADLDQIRAGIRYTFSDSNGMALYAKGEFINLKLDGGGFDESESGFGAHGGLAFNVAPEFQLTAEVGYVDVGDFGDGIEYNVGAGFSVTPQVAIIANYRVTDLEDGNFGLGSFDSKVSDIQAGVRFHF